MLGEMFLLLPDHLVGKRLWNHFKKIQATKNEIR